MRKIGFRTQFGLIHPTNHQSGSRRFVAAAVWDSAINDAQRCGSRLWCDVG
jgi:hypothetical protein